VLLALLVLCIITAINTAYKETPVGLDVRIIERPYRAKKWNGETWNDEVYPYSVETMRRCGYVEAKAFMQLNEAEQYATDYSLGMIIDGERRTVVAELKGQASTQSLLKG